MEELQTVPLAAYEAQATRFSKIMRYMIFGWAISVLALGLALVISMSYTEEVTETTSEVSQESDNYGSNHYIGGDYYGETDNQGNEEN